MTKEEAKNILINRGFVEINGDQVFDGNKWRNAITVISKWLEQEPCEDWYDVPSDEMTLEQARQAVKDLRKKLAEDLINQRATTCRHGGHCEWVACDKCNHYEPDGLNQQPCEDCISRQAVIDTILNSKSSFKNDFACGFFIDKIRDLPPVTPNEKTGKWIRTTDKSGHLVWECDKCGWQQRFNTNFCPDCGARMVSE